MEPSCPKICAICHESPKEEMKIVYCCDHTFCLECFPYVCFHALKTVKNSDNFFANSEKEFPCPICLTGKTKFRYENLCQQINFSSKEKIKPPFKCLCPQKNDLTNFCLKCQTTFCSYCLKTIHEGHGIIIPIEENLLKFCEKKSLQEEAKFLVLYENYSKWKDLLLKKLETSKEAFTAQFNNMIEEIIIQLQTLKEETSRKTILEIQYLNSQLELIQDSFSLLGKDFASKQDLHPNKQFHLMKLMEDIQEVNIKTIDISEGKINFDKDRFLLGNLQNIQMILNDLQKNTGKLMNIDLEFPLFNINENISSHKQVQSNPIEYFCEMESTEIIIDEKKFYPGWCKSNLSCNFSLNPESRENYLAWAGYSNIAGKTNYPLIIYNLSTMRKEAVLQNENQFYINFVSHFTKEDNDGIENLQKKWVYCGDMGGILRIYEINYSKSKANFSIKSEITTAKTMGKTKEILSAVIFHDKFKELDKNFASCYVMISLYDSSSPLLLYKNFEDNMENTSNNEDKWEIFRKILNPTKNFCFTMNFYHDELLKKTIFYFGFSESFIALYDFKNEQWEGEKHIFPTTDRVNSINFIFMKNKFSCGLKNNENVKNGYLVYTQENNEVIVGDIKNRKIERKVELKDVSCIYDCHFWGNNSEKNYLIVATYSVKLKSIQILDFDTLNVLFVKKLDQFPVNIMIVPRKKIKKCEKIPEENYNECLSCFLGKGDTSKILLFERK